MTDQAMQERYKRELKVARERRGAPSAERAEARKELSRVRKVLLSALEDGPKTIPELAAATGVEASLVLWHVAALRKYNQVADGPKQGDYIAYLKT